MVSGVAEMTRTAARIQRRGDEEGWKEEGFLGGDILSLAFKDGEDLAG